MKTRLLFGIFILSIFTTLQTQSQVISMIGDFNGWADDALLSTTDNINYTFDNFVLDIDGGLKFRQDLDWVVNWGSDTFPAGTGVQDGPNIPSLIGTYNVSFNIQTGDYLFETVLGIDDISNNIDLFYANNTLNIKGYSGDVTIWAYDIAGRVVNKIENIEVQNDFSRSFNLPNNQIIIIRVKGDNFEKTMKVISK